MAAAPRVSSRRRSKRQTRLRVLDAHGGDGCAPSLPLRATRRPALAGLALALSLGLHAALGVAVWQRGHAPPLARPLDVAPFPVRILGEPEPEATRSPARVSRPAPRLRPRAAPLPVRPEPATSAAPAAPSLPPAPVPAPAAIPASFGPAPPALASTGAPPPVAAGPPVAALPALVPLAQPAPHYPRAARLRGAEGTAWLRVAVAASGRVREVALERSAGDRDLDRAALDAVRRWRFAALPEEDAERQVRVPVEFRLR